MTAERSPSDVSILSKPMSGINYGSQLLAAAAQFSVSHCQCICMRPLLATGVVTVVMILMDWHDKRTAIHYCHSI